ncbi:hypothetical protein GGR44_000542 [Sphingobium fontiphilum]|uniref:Uncharacterized protein n=1 Tax=Sphingobium fontiphilum TaxID=944425 RepID=A0A7W6GM70_9SPHN|nr:hypothetical protein [Sphingobium fontiphilum]MBB3980911.1 hypothetical protein [Sphingobium fontiphilum]
MTFLVSTMAGANGYAQDATGGGVGRTAMVAMARCNIHDRERETGRVLDLPLGLEQRKEMARYSKDSCFPVKGVAYDQVSFRGALFIELLRQRTQAEAAGQRGSPLLRPIDLDMPVAASDWQSRLILTLLSVAKCVESKNPSGVRYALSWKTASVEQDEAFDKLRPNMIDCSSSSPELTSNKGALEGALAEVIYRLPAEDRVFTGVQ